MLMGIQGRAGGFLGVVLLSALVAGAHGPNPGGRAPQPFRSEILFSDSRAGLERGRVATSFAFAHLRDLWVRVTLPSLPDVTVLALTFVNPLGEEFYADVSYHSPDPRIRETYVAALGHALPVFRARRIPGGYALDRPIPIGGSSFLRIPMPDGTWQVRATIDGVPGTLAAPLEVILSR